MIIERTLHAASRARRSPALRRLEPVWRRVQPLWDRVVEAGSGARGYEAAVNGDRLRVSYRYGARYEKTGYEPAVHRAFTSRIREGMVVLDVGAHIGFFTLAAALRVGPSGHVYAFEPAPDTADVLERHVRMNGFEDRVTVVRAVLCDREGTTSFYVHGETMAAALFPQSIDVLSPERFETGAVEQVVAATTVDAFCEREGIEADRIKIDVEGAEPAVLRGASAALLGNAKILCEVHPAALAYMGGSVEELRNLLGGDRRSVEQVGDANALGILHLLSRPRG